jgi:hypothetical protein
MARQSFIHFTPRDKPTEKKRKTFKKIKQTVQKDYLKNTTDKEDKLWQLQ